MLILGLSAFVVTVVFCVAYFLSSQLAQITGAKAPKDD